MTFPTSKLESQQVYEGKKDHEKEYPVVAIMIERLENEYHMELLDTDDEIIRQKYDDKFGGEL